MSPTVRSFLPGAGIAPRGSSARAQCPREGREAMDTVIACAFTAVPSSTAALVAYACCVAAGNVDRIEGKGE